MEPTDFGTYPVTIGVQDTLGQSATQSYTIAVAPQPAPLPPLVTRHRADFISQQSWAVNETCRMSKRGGGFTIFQLNAWVETQDCASNFMSQTVRWTNITEEVRRLPSPLHDRVVAIMRGLDKRYGGLGTSRDPADTNTSRLTQWIDKNPGGHRVSIIGGTYAEEAGGPLRRVFAVLYDVDAGKPGWTNMRVELLGIDHEHPQHRESAQWKEANFLAWSRDLRHALLALGATGEPNHPPSNPPAIRLRAYIPPRMQWEPMRAFHDYIFRELEHGVGGRLVDPPHVLDSTDWVDYEFVLDQL